MNKNSILFFSIVLVVLIFSSCKNKTNQTTTPIAEEQTAETALPADFMQFYMRFHTDSLYQIEHITFPLAGFLPNVAIDSVQLEAHEWLLEDWKMHRPIDGSLADFRQEYQTLNNMVIEYIINDADKMAMERRFSKLGKDWYLIYYMGMNRVSFE